MTVRLSRRTFATGAASVALLGCGTPHPNETFDYIIVGGGTAGCVLANRLSADPAVRVLLLEAGGSGLSPLIQVPAALGRVIGNRSYDWCYPTAPDASRNGKADLYPCGKGLGGGSSINGMFFTRGQHADFDDWAAQGAEGWAFRDLLPYFKRSESSEVGDPEWRGKTGPVGVSRLRSVHPLSPIFLKAAAECGIPLVEDYNGPDQYGAAMAQVSQTGGWRCSAARAYLYPVYGRSNLKVVIDALTHRLTFSGRQCTGVEYERDGTTFSATAQREVILSAGTIGTPKILMLSGIGPGEHLKANGLPVLQDLPGVGQNLQEHGDVIISARVNVDTYNLIALSTWRMAEAVAEWAVAGRGPATSPYVQAVAFFNPLAPGERPTLEMMFAPFAFSSAEERARPYVRGAVNFVMSLCRPSARGRVSLASPDPRRYPAIAMDLLADADLPTLIAGCRAARRIADANAFKPYLVEERLPGRQVESDEDLIAYMRKSTFVGNHLVGTCRMGQDEKAVVSPDLRVKGVERLRVIDASIMPTLTSAHTNAVAFMIGEKGADLVLGRPAV